MKIAIAADHGGFELKNKIIDLLKSMENIEIIDKGTNDTKSVDYPDYAFSVAKLVSEKEADKGILICGSGVGMSMCANKVKGIRAALCNDLYTSEYSRLHNDANVLCIGARIVDNDLAIEIVKIWLSTEYEGGRHDVRVEKMNQML